MAERVRDIRNSKYVVAILTWFCAAGSDAFHRAVSPTLDISGREFSFLRSLTDLKSAFHFQPPGHWMNGPLFYRGYYHLFYQYNPTAPVWGNISWGHAVSKDMLQWQHLPIALKPDQWYDIHGVWSGSASIIEGIPVIFYTGSSSKDVQLQNMAFPANLSDSFLVKWVKAQHNPVLSTPPGASIYDFRDPTTAWKGKDGAWRMVVGSRVRGEDVALLYKSSDLIHWALSPKALHSTSGRPGMWECPDFYPVSLSSHEGLDASYSEADCYHVLKASFDDVFSDEYALGKYTASENGDLWAPLPGFAENMSKWPRYDYGKFYASKSFLDPVKKRRILWGWVNESDALLDDVVKGWASLQATPRTLRLDPLSAHLLVQEPVEELKALRGHHVQYQHLLEPGTMSLVDGTSGSQVDMEVTFTFHKMHDSWYKYWGPFGVSVLSSRDSQEETRIYFNFSTIASKGSGEVTCDLSKSSLLPEVDRTAFSGPLHGTSTSSFQMRILVDNSIIEVFAQHGTTCLTARAYPTMAIGNEAFVRVWNKGSLPVSVVVNAWNMHPASLRQGGRWDS